MLTLTLTSLPDEPNHAALEGVLLGVEAVAIGLLLFGRHWFMAAVCTVLLVMTYTRF